MAKLAKELKVSRQTFYSWTEDYKQRAMLRIERAGRQRRI